MADASTAEQRRADNRKAARASRLRKKARLEELQRSIVFLTKENTTLNERCQLLESALFTSVPPSTKDLVEHLKAENSALKIALYESVTTLARAAAVTGGESLAAALPAFVAEGQAQSAAPALQQFSSSAHTYEGSHSSRRLPTPEDPPAA